MKGSSINSVLLFFIGRRGGGLTAPELARSAFTEELVDGDLALFAELELGATTSGSGDAALLRNRSIPGRVRMRFLAEE
jgi:hypothetical protein